MMKVGLTGGYASGKSEVCKILRKLGAHVIDMDEVSRRDDLLTDDAVKLLLDEFGSEAVNSDSNLNRPFLKSIVFNNPDRRKKLESILHPLIRLASYKERDAVQKQNPNKIVIIEAPLIIESGLIDEIDILILVVSDISNRLHRGNIRDRIDLSFVMKIIDSQKTDSEKLPYADYVIENNGDLASLERSVLPLWYALCDRCGIKST